MSARWAPFQRVRFTRSTLMHVSVAAPVQVSALPAPSLRHKFHTDAKIKRPTQKGRFLALYSVMMSCRKSSPEFRFAPSTLRNFVPSGAAHEAAAGHALSKTSANHTATFVIRCFNKELHTLRLLKYMTCSTDNILLSYTSKTGIAILLSFFLIASNEPISTINITS